ncbi:hypothetical protein [Stappia sediminis]|nr:hypothetical protein [Stappia sediminis]
MSLSFADQIGLTLLIGAFLGAVSMMAEGEVTITAVRLFAF